MQNVHCREAKLQNFSGEHAPRAPLVLNPIFAAELILNCFRRACYYQWVILSIIILCILITQKAVSFFSVEKGAPSVLYRGIYFKDCWHEVCPSLKCTPLPKKLRMRLLTPYTFFVSHPQCTVLFWLIVINYYSWWHSIITKIQATDYPSIININRLIGIDCYQLSSIVIDRFHQLDRYYMISLGVQHKCNL